MPPNQIARNNGCTHSYAFAQVRRGIILESALSLRELHPPLRGRPTQLAGLGHRSRRQRERKPVLAAADLQGQRDQLVSLSASLARGAAARTDRRRLRGAAALEHRAGDRMTSSRRAAHANHI